MDSTGQPVEFLGPGAGVAALARGGLRPQYHAAVLT